MYPFEVTALAGHIFPNAKTEDKHSAVSTELTRTSPPKAKPSGESVGQLRLH